MSTLPHPAPQKPPPGPITANLRLRCGPPPPPAARMSCRTCRSHTYLKILLLVFLLNSLCLYFYFHSSSTPSPDLTKRHHDARDLILHAPPGASAVSMSGSDSSRSMKQWPILPSYLPWTNPGLSPSFASCEALFGNGFIKDLPVISPSSPAGRGGGGWFRCFFSENLGSSVCEGGSVRMNVGKIKMAKGGERLEEVIGRTGGAGEEMPVFEDGAFELEEGDGRKEGERLGDREFVDNYVGRNKMGERTIVV